MTAIRRPPNPSAPKGGAASSVRRSGAFLCLVALFAMAAACNGTNGEGKTTVVAGGDEEAGRLAVADRASGKGPESLPPHIRHFMERQEAFRAENRSRRSVVLLGDSITEGFDAARFLPGRPVLNRGIASDTIGLLPDEVDPRGVLKRLDTSVFDCCTSHVFLMIGINDLGDGRAPEAMARGYRRLLETIRDRAPGVEVHVVSVLPARGRFAFHNPNVLEFNERLRALAREFDAPYLDLHSLVVDAEGELREDFTRDGLHITEPAYRLWAREIEKAMGWDRSEA